MTFFSGDSVAVLLKSVNSNHTVLVLKLICLMCFVFLDHMQSGSGATFIAKVTQCCADGQGIWWTFYSSIHRHLVWSTVGTAYSRSVLKRFLALPILSHAGQYTLVKQFGH